MSRGSNDVVRQPISLNAGLRRRPEERLGIRFPGALALLTRALMRLPPRALARRVLIRRIVRQGIQAANRRDYASSFALYHPDVELIVPTGLREIGFEPLVQGREARWRFEVRWQTEWGDYRYEPEELRDLGERVLVMGRTRGRGPSSGAAFDTEWATVFTISAGWVVHEQVFLDHHEALHALGLA